MTQFPDHILKTIKANLLIEKIKIEENLASLKTQDPFSDPDRLNDNAASDTEANEETSHDRVEAIEKELYLHLEEVNGALSRLEKGTYGVCQNCKRMIDADRLAVKPTALLCLSCEEKKER